ncbi:HNH endonuclease [Celeribacter halophilus]|uniref:HNH endonuclease n=1 Tax=Celeribacter halophilus TaxID=576117 RepID=A0AAW7XMM9_9RHOB|nr:HNH endonuclease [Celeribacter halophilus]MDO6455518.1 HNH endonuclease [Celeribacter halophilus]MDO6721722.1 HNH endonuclease [Celeribacter halophilus]
MTIFVSHIVEALSSLGGQAHLDDIVKKVVQIAPAPLPEDPGASIRARIQERCAEAKSYKGNENLFESVYGIDARKGVWRLRKDTLSPSNHDSIQDGVEAFISAEEGKASLRIHLRRERSKSLIKAFKATLSDPSCEACGMKFSEVYGDLGAGYIEAHHKVPVSSLADGDETKLSDLAALCANCH